MNFFQKATNAISGFFKKAKDIFKPRKEKLFDAIEKGDEKRVTNLLREKDKIFSTFHGHSHSILEFALEKTDNVDIAKSIIKKCKFNLSSDDKEFGLHALRAAIFKKKNKIVKFLIEESGLKIEGKETRHLFSAAVGSNNLEMLSYMIKKDLIKFDAIKENNMSAGNYIALADDAEKHLTSHFQSQQEIADFIKLSKAKAMISFSYSTDDFGTSDVITERIFKSSVQNQQFEKKDEIMKIMELTFSRKNTRLNLPNGNILEVLRIPYHGHSAFALVEYDKNKKPLTVSYCDGNSDVFARSDDEKYGYGAITFKFDEHKVKDLQKKGGWEKFAIRNFSTYPAIMYENDGKNFYDTIAKFVVCDEKNHPIMVEKSIPTKPQNRGNCSLKSRHNVLREIMRRSDKEMVFEIDGKPAGKGYETFKAYKKCLIEPQIESLVELANKDNYQQSPYYQEVLQSLKQLFLKAVGKGNADLMKKMKDIFIRDGVDIVEIKDEKQRDCVFHSIKNNRKEIFEEFLDSGIVKPNSRYGNLTILQGCSLLGDREEIATMVLDKGVCDPKLTDKFNNTALHIALETKHFYEKKNNSQIADKLIDVLIERGGVTQTKNKDGYSIQELAEKYGYSDIAKKIEEKLQILKADSKLPNVVVSDPKAALAQNQNLEKVNSSVASFAGV